MVNTDSISAPTDPLAENGSVEEELVNPPESDEFTVPASGQEGAWTVTIPAGRIASTAATAVLTPVAVARRVLPAKGGLPLFAGLGGLALIGVLDWPVAIAAGAGYGLAKLVSRQDQHSA